MFLNFLGTIRLAEVNATPRMGWRRWLPPPVKLAYHIAKGGLRDLRKGMLFNFAKPCPIVSEMTCFIELSQPVIPNAWLSNKLHNFQRSAKLINAVTMQPGQVFSFCKIIGNPTLEKGYRKGRNIVNGRIEETYGGGLCQLSGILYHTSLMAGLLIVERHSHSVDLYANGEPRFTPLGADATVAFGHKDFRVANPFDFAVRFDVEVVGETLVCRLRSEQPLSQVGIEFKATPKQGIVEVLTLASMEDGEQRTINSSIYRTLI